MDNKTSKRVKALEADLFEMEGKCRSRQGQFRSLRVVREFSLNCSIATKMEEAQNYHGYSVLFNKACTLAHIIHSEDDGGYYRMPTKNLKGCSDRYIYFYFFSRVMKRFIL